MQRDLAYEHLQSAFPRLADMFEKVGRPRVGEPHNRSLAESVVSIIVGQMLSGAAAETIFHRLQSTAVECGLEGPHMLSVEQMKSAGVSGYKARAITEFSEALKREPNRFRNWAALDYEALCLDVSSLWGLSKWSASILALSHFGMVDVWPAEDGSIKRAVSKVREGLDPSFDPAAGSPVRSYLAKAFWAALDNKII